MLDHKVLTAKDVKGDTLANYYAEGADDYYAKEGDAKQWQGRLCDELGLVGDVSKDTFHDLLLGIIPNESKQIRLSQRNDLDARVGIDLTFAAPKSVSMQALVEGDPLIIEAHENAVARVLAEMEKLAQTRIKQDGKTRLVTTEKLAIAKFRHETNRDTEPHLHTHAIVLNFTKADDGKYRALVNDKLVKNSKFWGAKYRAELASELVKLGYQIRMVDDSFELAHISRSQIEAFSTRTASINEALEKKGLSRETATTHEKQLATYETRKKKTIDAKDIGKRQAIYSAWRELANSLGINFKSREHAYDSPELAEIANKDKVHHLKAVSSEKMAERAVRFSVAHHAERAAIMDLTKAKEVAINHATGHASPAEIDSEFRKLIDRGTIILADPKYTSVNDKEKREFTRSSWIESLITQGKTAKAAAKQVDLAIASGRLTRTNDRFTTQAILEQEKRILKRELAGRDKFEPLTPKETASVFLDTTTLRPDQRNAAEMMFTSRNQINGIQGLAGTGKSYLLKTVIPELERQGYNVVLLAPYGDQRKLLVKDGLDAKTVASWLNTQSRSLNLNENTIVIIDEAGVMPNRVMDQVTSLIQKNGARLTLLGDTEQTKAIENGMPFYMLQKNGMQYILMDDIQRQKDKPLLLEAVKESAKGHSLSALSKLNVLEIKDNDDRYALVAKQYTDLPTVERAETIVLSGTNESRVAINEKIRSNLELTGQGVKADALVRWDSTQSERQNAKYYKIGDIIQPEIDYKRFGLNRYGEYKIVDIQGNKLVVKDEENKLISFNPKMTAKMSVYKERKLEFSVGDLVRITRNDAKLDLTNGDKFFVTKITEDSIVISDKERTVSLDRKQRLHMDYAYCSTVHSAQGLTADRSIINIEANSRTTARDWFYVAISRAKKAVSLYTENKKLLPEKVARLSEKTMAHQIEKKSLRLNKEYYKGL